MKDVENEHVKIFLKFLPVLNDIHITFSIYFDFKHFSLKKMFGNPDEFHPFYYIQVPENFIAPNTVVYNQSIEITITCMVIMQS